MVGLLLDDKAGIVLSGKEEAALIEILACAVRRAVGSGLPPARTKGRVRALPITAATTLILAHPGCGAQR